MQYFQKLAMNTLRAAAAQGLNGATTPAAIFAIKGAPTVGAVDGLRISSGSLSINPVENVADAIRLQLSAAIDATFSTQAEYEAILAAMGLAPGDQLTFVAVFENPDQVVATYGNDTNGAMAVRYARITFKPEIPDDFNDYLIKNAAFNPLLIDSSEGIMPGLEIITVGDDEYLAFQPDNVSPYGYDFLQGGLIRSQKTTTGKFKYSTCELGASEDNFTGNNAIVYPSYGANAEDIEVGEKLYLQNAEAAPFSSGGSEPVSPYTITPNFPITTANGSSFTIKKNNGEAWNTAEVEALKFTIGGNEVSANASSTINWNVGGTSVLQVERTTFNDTLTVAETADDYTVSAVG